MWYYAIKISKVGAYMARVNEMIRQRRKELGMTLLQLADKVGVKEATAQRWESGAIKNIPYERVIQIASALDCPPSYLMGWIDKEPTTHESGELDEISIQIADILLRLSPEKKAEALHYLQYLEAREDN